MVSGRTRWKQSIDMGCRTFVFFNEAGSMDDGRGMASTWRQRGDQNAA
jgi:hypothetical protein